MKTPFVGAMKIARQRWILASTPMNGASPPGSLSEGVSPDEWKTPFVGAMKIARQRWIIASTPMNGASPPGSLPEGAAERSEAEGVSSDGCSGPMVYSQRFIGSEIFERLRSSGYTPSVSHSLDSSLREGAGNGCPPFNVPPGSRNVAGDFHRPYGTQNVLHSTVQPGAR